MCQVTALQANMLYMSQVNHEPSSNGPQIFKGTVIQFPLPKDNISIKGLIQAEVGYIAQGLSVFACEPAGGWFHTGDQGFLDEDGYVTLTGRIKELINRGGEKISPIEVCSPQPDSDASC